MKIESVADALLPSLVGMLIVFFCLFFLMCVIYLLAYLLRASSAAHAHTEGSASGMGLMQSQSPTTNSGPREVSLIEVSDAEAAMIMAIVADEMQLPPEQLAFEYIKRL